MKRVVTVIAMFMSLLFGGVFLASCSNGYKDMKLEVEYALPGHDDFIKVDDNKFDYTLTQEMYSQEDLAYVLFLRINVKGTKKKVDSLYISQSANNSIVLQSNVVKPNETFKVLVKNIGSVKLTAIPSNGGEDKAISFDVNIYRELEAIEQNVDCVPAMVTGASTSLELLTNLIKYHPLKETNQTGVNYTIESVGTLINNGTNDLIHRTFVEDTDFLIEDERGLLVKKKKDENTYVSLNSTSAGLLLTVSPKYDLNRNNNVIQLKATSRYNSDISTIVYVYIVENFTANSLLVSYKDDIVLDPSGNVPTRDTSPVGQTVEIFNSIVDGIKDYSFVNMYTYTNRSIYSYESNPGIKLTVYVNGEVYDYNDVVDNSVGIQITPINRAEYGESKLVGLKFEVNPNAINKLEEYNIRLELDFTAFDFSQSGKTPVSVLNKEFILKVNTLASGFYINGKSYQDNVEGAGYSYITEYDSNKTASLYTYYELSSLGMPLNIQATPTNAINTDVYVSFYKEHPAKNGELDLSNKLTDSVVDLMDSRGFNIRAVAGEYLVDFENKNQLMYLALDKNNLIDLKEIYMVCRAVCTPETFNGTAEDKEYITFIAKIDVVGAVESIKIYKNHNDNINSNTLDDKYLSNGQINVAYINLASTSTSLNLNEVLIQSANGKIQFSADGRHWYTNISADLLTDKWSNSVVKNEVGTKNALDEHNNNPFGYKILYFKTNEECNDKIIISSPNGIGIEQGYEFVNITNKNSVSISYDTTYITDFENEQILTYETDNVALRFLALQSGRMVQFSAVGNNKTSNIKAVTAKSLTGTNSEYTKILQGGESYYATSFTNFSPSAIKVSNVGRSLFDVRANSVEFTAILFVKVDFYAHNGTEIVEQNKYFIYEVAVYNPANELAITSTKDNILYINDHYADVARVDFNINVNATSRMYFSSETVNNKVNLSYDGENASIYGIEVELSENADNQHFAVNGLHEYEYAQMGWRAKFLNNSTKTFSIRAVKSLLDLINNNQNSIYIDITIYQFGIKNETTTVRKVVFFGGYEKVEGIVIDGVDNYSNLYLSLKGNADAQATIFATASNDGATYKDLGYALYLIDEGVMIDCPSGRVEIIHNPQDDSFKIVAKTGGIYQLELFARDSYDNNGYKIKRSVRITVSDGKSEETAYLIGSLTEFEEYIDLKATEPRYYRLAKDLNISALSDNWWKDARVFNGVLDGSITINDPNSGKSIIKNYVLTGLTIKTYNTLDSANCFGLFSSNIGTIKNIIFDSVRFDIVIDSKNSSTDRPINIGAITAINNGIIENCSVNIVSSVITVKNDHEGTNEAAGAVYNIGLVAGINTAVIKFNNSLTNSAYTYMTDSVLGGKLQVIVEEGNELLNKNTNIYIGGVVGQNSSDSDGAIISASYIDKSDKSIRELITAVVNIEVMTKYNATYKPMTIDNIAIGGVAGYNSATIEKIAVSGKLRANDKANIGGVVGYNTAIINQCANYGMYIEGYSLNDEISSKTSESLIYHGADATQEQNVGGIVGFNFNNSENVDDINVDNVRVLFMLFSANEVKIEPANAKIKGVGNVGGVIGRANNTQLIRAYVENFVPDEENELDYNIIGYGANVAGLIAQSLNSSAKLSFVQADFDVRDKYAKLTKEPESWASTYTNYYQYIDGKFEKLTGSTPDFASGEYFELLTTSFYEFGKELDYTYTYFIGDVFSNNITAGKELVTHKSAGSAGSNVYIINQVVYVEGENVDKKVNAYGVDGIKLNDEDDATLSGYTIVWRKDTTNEINNSYPYLACIVEEKDVPTLTIRPNKIIVNVDEGFFDEDAVDSTGNKFEFYNNGIYIQYVDNNKTTDDTTDDRVRATAVVYYYKDSNNTHKLITDGTQKGLVEKAIIPSIATGIYSVSIVAGEDIATLISGDTSIKFSGTGKVELLFVSGFDRKIEDKVVIFVENPIHEDVFDISTSAGLEDRLGQGTSFTTQTQTASTVKLGLKQVNDLAFESTKLCMDSQIKYVKDNNGNVIADYDELFEFKPITNQVSTGKYAFGQFELSTGELISDINYLTIEIDINIYLNLNKYSINGETLDILMGSTESLIYTRTITVVVYNRATDLKVSSDAKIESGVGTRLDIELVTGYVGGENQGHSEYEISGNGGSKLTAKVPGQDSIIAVLTAKNKNAEDLLNRARVDAENEGKADFSVWNIFRDAYNDILIGYQKTSAGYKYTIDLRLIEKYRYLDLTGYTDREWKFNIEIIAYSNRELSKNIELSFVPQQLTSFRIENYTNLVSYESITPGITQSEFKSNEVESSLIIPGESGLLKIYAEYDYSYFDNITITSNIQPINGNNYYVRFQQMVYNKTKEVYESYAGITADGASLRLAKVSYSDGSYDGIIFVRTLLDNFVGVKELFEFTVSADTYDLNGNVQTVSRYKTVISQYRPGVYIDVTNAIIRTTDDNRKVYLVENQTYATNIVATVYGYEFNVQPQETISGLIEGVSTTSQIIRSGEAVKDKATGAYIINYKLLINDNNPFKIKMKMELLDNGNTLTGYSQELIFYPVPYLLNGVHVRGEANNILNIAINSSKQLELLWKTQSTSDDKIAQIKEDIEENHIDYLDLFYIKATDSNGRDYNKYFSSLLNATNNPFAIRENEGEYYIDAYNKARMTIYVDLWYGYIYNADLDKWEVKFSITSSETCNNRMHHEFILDLTIHTTEDAPDPITTAEELRAMSDGENYILMNDITLDNWTPLTANIASLDGNGKIINIKSFSTSVQAEYNMGLFATIGKNSIIKNLVINIGALENNLGTNQSAIHIKDDNIAESKINFGILAGVNEGLIYNCEVISIQNSRFVEIVIGDGYKLTFGGLVGVNNGNITNSRVGTEYFEQLTENNGKVSSVIISCGTITFKSRGIMAGFVGVNSLSSIISSSYSANTGIDNTSNIGNINENRTAGFVASNAGLIAYSYVKGLERSILVSGDRASSAIKIYASGSGNVGGFAFENTGEIHDCYSNIYCKSSSAGVAGFVYDTSKGKVVQCYSASEVTSGSTSGLATQLPFVGVGLEKNNANQLLSSADVINCYYLIDSETKENNKLNVQYDTHYLCDENEAQPKELSLESFAISTNLNNYSFIEMGSLEQQLNGVWTYNTAIDKNKSIYSMGVSNLPELTSANKIARSLRVYDDSVTNGELKSYKYPAGYEMGSAKNPYIIRSAEEYKQVFELSASTVNEKTYKNGHVRFVNDISFKEGETYINIDTRSNYVLGDTNNNSLTVIDGNGMTVSDVIINYANDDAGNLGLFSEVYYSVIKGLNIKYASQSNADGSEVGSSTVNYAGGIAGTAKNTYLIDLKLSGGVALRAHNVVGGAVGRLTGENSGLFNITSDLTVQAGNYSKGERYDDEDSLVYYLSYAGGIAGIIDIQAGEQEVTNISKLTVLGASVRANRAGGIAGFMGVGVNAKRLTYNISTDSQILGREVAGGLIGDNFADIEQSQVTFEIDEQYKYDKAFGDYINNDTLTQINNSQNGENNSIYGNLSAVTGDEIVGGFIGVNYGGDIENSLTKANISSNKDYGFANIVGGFIGKAYGGDLKYVYAQNYIELGFDESVISADNRYITGGLVGYVASAVKEGHSLPVDRQKLAVFGLDNVVTANWFDKSQIADRVGSVGTNYVVDYLIGERDSLASGINIAKSRTETSSQAIVSYGVFNADKNNLAQYADGKIKNLKLPNIADYYDMESLYNMESPIQQEIFEILFISWPIEIWDLDNSRFMPNLREDNATDFIPIKEEADLEKIEKMPDRNFIVMNDINLSNSYQNYVINANFTGILIGKKQDSLNPYEELYPTIRGITLNASTSNDLGAGFFKQTTNARISNVNFEYSNRDPISGINLGGGGSYIRVGGVSSNDENSRFEKIKVTQRSTVPSVVSVYGTSVIALGSIVGESKQSKIITCSSSLSYRVKVGNDISRAGKIGGLVGSVDGLLIKDEQNVYDGLIQGSSYTGHMIINHNEGAFVGGIVGWASYTHVSGSATTGTITISGSSADSAACYIGGIVAMIDMGSVSGSKALTSIVAQKGTKYYIGGIIGQVAHSGAMIGADTVQLSSAILTISGINDVTDVVLGGIVAYVSSEQHISLSSMVADVRINSAGAEGVLQNCNNVEIGGIAAYTTSNKLDIDSAVAIMDCEIDYKRFLIGGGIIGHAVGAYTITESTSIGKLFANNPQGYIDKGENTLTILGGFVGLAGSHNGGEVEQTIIESQIINYSYTVLTMSTANVYKGTVEKIKHEVYTNAIIGHTYDNNKVESIGVIYSSDYTLAFEKAVKIYENEKPKNVTANVLLNNNQTLSIYSPSLPYDYETNKSKYPNELYGCIGDNWNWKDRQLPFPKSTLNLLSDIGLIDKYTYEVNGDKLGQAYKPYIVSSSNTSAVLVPSILASSDNYNYFIVTTDINIASSLESLNGLILGNNQVITAKTTMFTEIKKHSAISNVTLILTSEFGGNAGVAETNNGTVFMTGVQYENEFLVQNEFGGIVSRNNGLISNCYNMGNTEVDAGDVGGLVYNNTENASLEDSYFTGSFSGGSQGSALAHINDGYIYNCYSAGMANSFVATRDFGRFKNVYFDYYANYVSKDEYDELEYRGITGLSTKEMQEVYTKQAADGKTKIETSDSKKLSGWKVYSMHNLADLRTDNPEITTYNYGYPIHNFEQWTYGATGSSGNIRLIPIRVKATGDGTFNEIKDSLDKPIIDIAHSTYKVKGQLVAKLNKDNQTIANYDNCSFLINNLGVLYLINDMAGTKDIYFELQTDIKLPKIDGSVTYKEYDGKVYKDYKLLTDWQGVGTVKNPFEGIFNTTQLGVGSGDKVILDTTLADKADEDADDGINSNNIYNLTKVQSASETSEKYKVIENLCGKALFNNVSYNALIANIVVKDSKITESPLIGNVISNNTEDPPAKVTVYNAGVSGTMSYTSSTGKPTDIAGLVKKVDDGNTLNLHSVIYSELTIDATQVSFNDENIVANAVAGVIGANNGTINIKNSFAETKVIVKNATATETAGFISENGQEDKEKTQGNINFVDAIKLKLTMVGESESAEISNANSVYGFVATNIGNILTVAETNSSITLDKIAKVTGEKSSIAGFVGEMKDGTIGGFDIEFEATDADKYVAPTFAGVAVTLQGGQLGSRETTGSETLMLNKTRTITVNLTTATANIYGGVVANAEANGAISNVEIVSTEKIVVKPDESVTIDETQEETAYGLIIGQYTNKLSEIYYTIKDPVNFEVRQGVNVGGIIGVAEANEFNFTSENNSTITVKGQYNVGGFIGKFIGSAPLEFTGKTWMIAGEGETGYASVEVAVPDNPKNDGENLLTIGNFGGLFGYWDSDSPLMATNDKGNKIINNNTVLAFEGIESEQLSWFKTVKKDTNTQNYNITIKNVGGVVGKSNAGIEKATNKAVVGYNVIDSLKEENPHKGNHVIYATKLSTIDADGKVTVANGRDDTPINQIVQAINVGGVVGYIEKDNLEIKDCSNTGSVYGMYFVGGIVGYSKKGIDITMSSSGDGAVAHAETKTIIFGLADIGGIIGRCDVKVNISGITSGEDESAETLNIGTIYGITNVGGVVGYAEEAQIANFNITSSIIANFNVGGVVGYATNAKLTNIKVIETEITATIFDYYYNIENEKGKEDKGFYYIPTNIGGVVGYVKGDNSSFNTVTTTANIKTDETYIYATKSNDEGRAEDQMLDINMAQIFSGTEEEIEKNISDIMEDIMEDTMKYLEGYYKTIGARVETVYNGIGGFAGRMNLVRDVDGQSNCKDTGVLANSKIISHYGINVGGVVGYVYVNADAPLTIPSLPTELVEDDEKAVQVAGKVFVGGYIGRINGTGDTTDEFFSANSLGYVNVQQYEAKHEGEAATDEIMVGNCVGGVIGYSTGRVTGIKLEVEEGSFKESPIKVFNAVNELLGSTHVGAIVGRLDAVGSPDGDMEDCRVASEFCDVDKKSGIPKYDKTTGIVKDGHDTIPLSGIIQSVVTYNYGGLVGLANVRKGVTKLTIKGDHYYAFTVEMVQNQDYYQGESQYACKDTGGDSNVLVANAHYINLTTIEISDSKLSYLCNMDQGLGDDTLNGYNPTNPKARGWAPEYTKFRMLARVIPQDEPTGDSIQVLYNANYITEVKRLGYKIYYTIYQPFGQSPRLYCEYGIARLDSSFVYNSEIDVSEEEDPGYFAYEKNYQVTIDKGEWKGLDEEGYVITKSYTNEDGEVITKDVVGRPAFWRHVEQFEDLGISYKKVAVNYIDGKQVVQINKDYDDDVKAEAYQRTFGYSYYEIDGYLSETDENKSYFVFDTIFAEYVKAEGDESVDVDERLLSNSGSIFEVTGLTYKVKPKEVEDGEAWLKWVGIGLACLALAALVVLGIGTVGFGVVWGYLVMIPIGLAGIGVILHAGFTSQHDELWTNRIATAIAYQEDLYKTMEETSMGYLGTSYGRGISWQDGKLDASSDALEILLVDAQLTPNEGGLGDLNEVEEKLTSDQKLLLAQLNIDVTNKTSKAALTYFNCATSSNMVADINGTVTVQTSKIENSDLKTIFNELNVQSFTVPKYCLRDGELYRYNGTESGYRILYPNYNDVAGMETAPGVKKYTPGYDLINENGYAYLLNDPDNDTLVPESHNDYLDKTYHIKRTTNKTVKFSIYKEGTKPDNSKVYNYIDDYANNIRWTASYEDDYSDEDYQSVTDNAETYDKFRYYGPSEPHDGIYNPVYSIRLDALFYEGINYYEKSKDEYISTVDGKTRLDAKSVATATQSSAYFVYQYDDGGSDKCEILVKLSPQSGSPEYGAGIKFDKIYQLKAKTYNLVFIDRDGDGAGDGNITLHLDYTLTTLSKYSSTDTSAGIFSKTKLPDDFSITVYKYDSANGTIGNAEMYVASHILNNWDTFKSYSMSKDYYDALSNYYEKQGNELYYKSASLQYLSESHTEGSKTVNYVYMLITENTEMNIGYTNRYVYNYELLDTTIKMYTRYYYGNTFLDGDKAIKQVVIEKEGSQQLENRKVDIWSLLLPSSYDTEIKDVIFSEGVRVTLSVPSGKDLYTVYNATNKEKITGVKFGYIK